MEQIEHRIYIKREDGSISTTFFGPVPLINSIIFIRDKNLSIIKYKVIDITYSLEPTHYLSEMNNMIAEIFVERI